MDTAVADGGRLTNRAADCSISTCPTRSRILRELLVARRTELEAAGTIRR